MFQENEAQQIYVNRISKFFNGKLNVPIITSIDSWFVWVQCYFPHHFLWYDPYLGQYSWKVSRLCIFSNENHHYVTETTGKILLQSHTAIRVHLKILKKYKNYMKGESDQRKVPLMLWNAE